jgi:hypothetical protein
MTILTSNRKRRLSRLGIYERDERRTAGRK